jgi:cyclopropane fatty-acyl-phospholipid synthase-like methyltransferase
MTSKSREWFTEWFDSEYYHLLYKHRNDEEAEHFMDTLSAHLNILEGETILDIPCGKGRHSIYLAKKGFQVTGADLSVNSIETARQNETDKLRFVVHDMRNLLPARFKYVFNLFTSFGYFDEEAENVSVLKSFRESLEYDGILVLDYLNTHVTTRDLVPGEEKEIEGINFIIKRFVEDGVIVKEISFTDKGHDYYFQERVRAYEPEDFARLFHLAGLSLISVYGDYRLNPYLPEKSDRMIFVLKKS